MAQAVKISEKSKKLKECFINNGVVYRENKEPVSIIMTTQPTFVEPSEEEMDYLGGFASSRLVPAGTILCNRRPITPYDFTVRYIPYLDEEGNVIPGKYITRSLLVAVPNPYGRPVYTTDKDGNVVSYGDEDCVIFMFAGSDEPKYRIMSHDEFHEKYVPYYEAATKVNGHPKVLKRME